MKRGTIVAVCHDGKWGRRVKGVVVDTRNGHHIKVRFENPDDETEGAPKEIEFWARVRPTIHYLKKCGFNSYRSNRYKSFGGWADIDYWCPWFAVYKWVEADV
jgi:hypothetical protein